MTLNRQKRQDYWDGGMQSGEMRVLICPDKFKGTLSALEVCRAIAEGILRKCPEAEIELLPIADGGEGTVEAFCAALRGTIQSESVSDPLGRQAQAFYASLPNGDAVLELAAASGLRLVREEERDPLGSNTFGLGELMLAATRAGAKRLVIGLGGSATNDAGVGMAAALGYRFLDANGREVEPTPREFLRIGSIAAPAGKDLPSVVALCDVTNPLTGPQGATAVYGPQKGVRPEQVAELDAALRHLANLVERDLGIRAAELPGAGAAGGMGFGLVAFAGADLRGGFDVVAEITRLPARIAAADLVITGEGRLDSQSISGKGPAGVAAMARNAGKRIICIPGMAEESPEVLGIFDRVLPLVANGVSSAMAMAEPARWLAERGFEAI